MRPVAGSMRPKTNSSGIFNTNRSRPVSVRRFTRMFVPKPKKAFQSPGTHTFGLVVMDIFSRLYQPSAARTLAEVETQPKIPPWALIIFRPISWNSGKVGADAVGGHEALVAAVVGLPHGGVDADFRGDAGDDELLDAAVLQDGMQVGGPKSAFAGLVDDRLAGGEDKVRQ